MTFINNILLQISNAIPSLIYAILFLVVAFVVAYIAKKLVIQILTRLNFGQKLSKHDKDYDEKNTGGLVETIGKIVFVLVFVLFLPGILDNLNLHGVSQPITNMMNSLIGFLPNVFGAVIIILIGNFLAKTVKQILISILSKIKFDKLQTKVGIEEGESTVGFSTLIGNVVYALILIVAAIAALQILNIAAISVPAVAMLNSIFAMIPNVFTAVLLVFVGVMIGRLAGSLLSAFLSSVGINNWTKDLFHIEDGKAKFVPSNLIGDFVKYLIIVLFVVQSFGVLRLDVLNNIGVMIIAYLPNFVGAVIILCLGFFLSNLLEKAMKKHASVSPLFAKLLKSLIMAVTVFMTLNQLNIAAFIVNAAFVIILCAIAVAFALAFGLGGRDFAAKTLEDARGNIENKAKDELKEEQ